MSMKTPHKKKLLALFSNPKLPLSDRDKKQSVFRRYGKWITVLRDKSLSPEEYLSALVKATNQYKNFMELEFIFGSDNDFLYRQKGQLKLDNSILEECLPYIVDERLVPGAFTKDNYFVGDETSYAGLRFGPWTATNTDDRIYIKGKNQDFAVGKKINVTIQDGPYIDQRDLNVAYFVCEIKTNIDKTMMQEASATARELKSNVQNSKYFIVGEWLDMPPFDSSTTSIDKVVVLRKAKRLNSNKRSVFSTAEGRRSSLKEHRKFIFSNQLDIGMFQYLVEVLNEALPLPDSMSDEVKLDIGYF
jgi:hypothetical protein